MIFLVSILILTVTVALRLTSSARITVNETPDPTGDRAHKLCAEGLWSLVVLNPTMGILPDWNRKRGQNEHGQQDGNPTGVANGERPIRFSMAHTDASAFHAATKR